MQACRFATEVGPKQTPGEAQKVVAVLYRAGEAAKNPKLLGDAPPGGSSVGAGDVFAQISLIRQPLLGWRAVSTREAEQT